MRIAFWALIVAFTAAVTALVVVHLVRFDGGPLDQGIANGLGGDWPSGVALGLGMFELHNASGHAVMIERVRLGAHTPGIRYLGTLVARQRCPLAPTLASFPPRSGACRYVPAQNLTLPPHAMLEGYVGIEAPTGRYRIRGVIVDYTRRLVRGVTLRMRAHAGPTWAMCMTPDWPRKRCKAPAL